MKHYMWQVAKKEGTPEQPDDGGDKPNTDIPDTDKPDTGKPNVDTPDTDKPDGAGKNGAESSVKTGDSANLIVWGVLLIISGIGGAVLLRRMLYNS